MPLSPNMSASIRRAGAIVAATLIAATVAADAQAASTTYATCTNAISLYISPGYTLRPGSGTGSSHGELGTQVCTGTLYGHRITGPGTVGVEEIYTATCLGDTSSGKVAVTLPTTAGPIHVVGALSGSRIGFLEIVEIDFPNAHFTGTGPVLPTRGDCTTAPITRALVSITGTLRG